MKITIVLTLLLLSACQQHESQVASDTNNTDESNSLIKDKPVLKGCTKEARVCPDGSSVGRNPKKNCEFDLCQNKASKPTSKMCTADVKQCPDGSYVSRDHYNNCKFKDCPTTKKATR